VRCVRRARDHSPRDRLAGGGRRAIERLEVRDDVGIGMAPVIDREAGRATRDEADDDDELPARIPKHAPTIARAPDPR
jgi:hypothetical protein